MTTVTKHGAVIGTVAYMSPEQLRGKPVDHRSDIFSFGAILYEMMAGSRAFRGETDVDTMTAVLREEPASHQSGRGCDSCRISGHHPALSGKGAGESLPVRQGSGFRVADSLGVVRGRTCFPRANPRFEHVGAALGARSGTGGHDRASWVSATSSRSRSPYLRRTIA